MEGVTLEYFQYSSWAKLKETVLDYYLWKRRFIILSSFLPYLRG